MSETDEWRLGTPLLALRVLRSRGFGKAARLSGRPPGCEPLRTTSLTGAAWRSPQWPHPPPFMIGAGGNEWPLGTFQRDVPFQDI